jgi:nicotinamidase-related amidase
LVLVSLVAGLAVLAVEPAPADGPSDALHLSLRTRIETFKGSGNWDEATVMRDFRPAETAIILCDVWDKHWCDSATTRCGALAKKMEVLLKDLRARGVLVIHAPSDCMDYYKDTPQRQLALEAPKVPLPKPLDLTCPDLPIDDKDGGCDDPTPAKSFKAWTREHPAITVADNDVVSDNGQEVFNVLQKHGIKNLLIVGVHTNMCVLNRTFAIKQMTKWGIRCVLVRDLTDAMYNPKKAPFVSHDEGTELVIQYIEKYWCPSVLSSDLMKR